MASIGDSMHAAEHRTPHYRGDPNLLILSSFHSLTAPDNVKGTGFRKFPELAITAAEVDSYGIRDALWACVSKFLLCPPAHATKDELTPSLLQVLDMARTVILAVCALTLLIAVQQASAGA